MKVISVLFIMFLFASCTPVRNTEMKITTIDTDFSKGRIGLQHEIGLNDLENFHGHLCDGLVVGFLGLHQALVQLYPDKIIDRTNTRIVSKPSPCLTDAAIYLTGGRYQFGTFYVSSDFEGLYIVQRIDTKEAWAVRLKDGAKPSEIDRLGTIAVSGNLSPCGLDSLKEMEDQFTKKLLEANPEDYFEMLQVKDFDWNPTLRNDFTKTDILNKNQPKCNQ